MADPNGMAQTIKRICLDTLGHADFGEDEDFFNRGASSLTIVDMQLKIEEALGCKAATSELMRQPTIAGWSRIYRAAAEELSAG